MHLKWEVDRQWPESQTANDSHNVIEKREQGCHDGSEAHEGSAPDERQEAQPKHAALPERDVHSRVKETAPREPVVDSALHKSEKGLGYHLHGKPQP